ncbi:hypothetical protein KPG71_19540 [Roseovarius sp. PS-C2]|uniref:DUF6602 domain-containing protein n=1 Tax=Roseovarius sp. PS-C2 TaxID=2820814 RepID=UPI001C0BD591|nr:DUF6602 domain-containing protein [Roseovarius sp. PS-C2]MBU3262213.1 hypothetical protein [Roseovarius sp. PS-C2]
MAKSFSGFDHLQLMAQRLVYDFDEAAGAGHPGLIGAARETPARLQLERVLPGNIGIGSGIVVDSFGGLSKQQDIVIFEKHLCPVFSINDTPEATYYPIEGVLAVGEVKSSLDRAKLEDAFSKIQSVKSLNRVVEVEEDALGSRPTVPYRKYGSQILISGTEAEQYSTDRSLDQVFGFVLAGNSSLKPETLLNHAVDFAKSHRPHDAPNTIVSLTDGHISWMKSEKNSLGRSPMEADMLAFCSGKNRGFPWLISLLRLYAEAGRTVSTRHYRKYFRGQDDGHPVVAVRAVVRPER